MYLSKNVEGHTKNVNSNFWVVGLRVVFFFSLLFCVFQVLNVIFVNNFQTTINAWGVCEREKERRIQKKIERRTKMLGIVISSC